MRPTPRSRIRSATVLVVAAALASAIGTGTGATVAQEPLSESCAMQVRSPIGGRGIDPNCETDAYATCSYYEDVHGRIRIVYGSDQYCLSYAAIEAAQAEAAAWPDFNPSDMTTEVAVTEAEQEAATWPDFNPSDMTTEVAVTEAEQEAATWPKFDSTAIGGASTDITNNSPRMTQIAAEAGSGETTVSRGNPFVL